MGLEDKVGDRESKGFARKALGLGFKAALAAGATVFSMATVGTLGPIIGGAFAGGAALGSLIKKKPIYDVVNESLKAYTGVNAVLHPVLSFGNATYPLIDNSSLIGKIARSVYAMTVHNAVFVGLYKAAGHLYDNYLNPRGIIGSVKDNFYNAWKRIALLFAPGYALAANGVTELVLGGLKIPTFAANALPAGMINQIWPIPEKKSARPNYGPAMQPSYA